MSHSRANPDPHADVWWVTGAFILSMFGSAALLLQGKGLSLALGGVLWTLLFGALLLTSIRLCVIAIENVFAASLCRPPCPCVRCGYDVRGLPDSWRCPECGELYIDRRPSSYP